MKAVRALLALDPLAMAIGCYAAAFGRRWGAWLLVGWLVARAAYHLGIGVLAYRDAMSKPWPEVPALADWDDDE